MSDHVLTYKRIRNGLHLVNPGDQLGKVQVGSAEHGKRLAESIEATPDAGGKVVSISLRHPCGMEEDLFPAPPAGEAA